MDSLVVEEEVEHLVQAIMQVTLDMLVLVAVVLVVVILQDLVIMELETEPLR